MYRERALPVELRNRKADEMKEDGSDVPCDISIIQAKDEKHAHPETSLSQI